MKYVELHPLWLKPDRDVYIIVDADACDFAITSMGVAQDRLYVGVITTARALYVSKAFGPDQLANVVAWARKVFSPDNLLRWESMITPPDPPVDPHPPGPGTSKKGHK